MRFCWVCLTFFLVLLLGLFLSDASPSLSMIFFGTLGFLPLSLKLPSAMYLLAHHVNGCHAANSLPCFVCCLFLMLQKVCFLELPFESILSYFIKKTKNLKTDPDSPLTVTRGLQQHAPNFRYTKCIGSLVKALSFIFKMDDTLLLIKVPNKNKLN